MTFIPARRNTSPKPLDFHQAYSLNWDASISLPHQMNRLFLVILVLFFCSVGFHPKNARAQCVLSGLIRDAHTKQALWGVGIQSSDGRGGISDREGKFSWNFLTDTSVSLKFSFLGYEAQQTTIQKPCSERIPLDIQLRPQNQELNPIIVTAGRSEQGF